MHQILVQKTVYYVNLEHIQKKKVNLIAILAILGLIQLMVHHFVKNAYLEHAQIKIMVQQNV